MPSTLHWLKSCAVVSAWLDFNRQQVCMDVFILATTVCDGTYFGHFIGFYGNNSSNCGYICKKQKIFLNNQNKSLFANCVVCSQCHPSSAHFLPYLSSLHDTVVARFFESSSFSNWHSGENNAQFFKKKFCGYTQNLEICTYKEQCH